jgi:L-ascorbate metabolism protein UlaG (beta-lactamase superfamily)
MVTFGAMLYLRHPKFGRKPAGERLERMVKSPNYRDNQFQNLTYTPVMAEDVSYFNVFKEFLFNNNKRKSPDASIQSVKADLLSLQRDRDLLIWFGHSSYFLQIHGMRFLVDPVLCGNASPFKFSVKSFPGSDVYSPEELPDIDYLFITHDHWDHLDYETLIRLKPRIKHIITALGVGAHLEHWGFDKSIIKEGDWYDTIPLDPDFTVTFTPSRHFSGRTFTRNQTLWTSFVLKAHGISIFMGADGGYDTHFKDIGEKYGPFDLALLECGQYNKNWKYIHSMPEDAMKAANDLKASQMMILHWSKFRLANHDWDEPIIRITELCKAQQLPLLSPVIGELSAITGKAP